MPPLKREELDKALEVIQQFRNQLLQTDSLATKMLDGTLYELSVHFLQRAMVGSYCFDLDFIVIGFDEKDKPIIKALVEIKTQNGKLTTNQKEVYLKIAATLAIPAYLLIFYDINQFKIIELTTEKDLGFFTFEELENWFKELSKQPIKRKEKTARKVPRMYPMTELNQEV